MPFVVSAAGVAPPDGVVLVHTHEDGQVIAQRLRAGLRDRGLLEGEEFKVTGRQGERALDLVLARGDRVRITENAAALGLTNGDLAEIVSIRANDGGHELQLRIQARGGGTELRPEGGEVHGLLLDGASAPW